MNLTFVVNLILDLSIIKHSVLSFILVYIVWDIIITFLDTPLSGDTGLLTRRFCFFRQECEQHNRLTKLKDEEMKRRHEIERKRLPKIQRDEIKAKSQQYRKSIRMEKRVSVDIEREMMKEVTSHEIQSFLSFQGVEGRESILCALKNPDVNVIIGVINRVPW